MYTTATDVRGESYGCYIPTGANGPAQYFRQEEIEMGGMSVAMVAARNSFCETRTAASGTWAYGTHAQTLECLPAR